MTKNHLSNNTYNLSNLVVDIGNTRIKTAVFDNDVLINETPFEDIKDFLKYSKELHFRNAIISSVKYSEIELQELLEFDFLYLNKSTPIPITNMYKTPETLGVDRKAAVIGARATIGNGAILTVDMGSCITYEILDAENRYLGGAISPGLKMRFRAMHEQTARLPMAALEGATTPELTGNTTISCMQSGVYHGILHEIEGYIQAYSAKYDDLKVIICGGDSKVFESLTKDHIFVIQNLVLYGLNRILSYNVNLH
ncbi:type III pantothenate kinase [Mongoliibacter ruber]|uniref:Type III pantothenate kinase n=1 Tax=Mongoliibacter ruber TaxID=1750599 RepID=A0A2T0WRF7_9BACT|nr:type III pantothenate kinase [Mongoliibacter ruber]PRY89293.1 type III pantothenate kinase [Mongoliibacter ruber]